MSGDDLKAIRKEEIPCPQSEQYLKRLEEQEKQQSNGTTYGNVPSSNTASESKASVRNAIEDISPQENLKEEEHLHELHDRRANFPDTPVRPSEKRKVHTIFRPLLIHR